MSKIEIVEVGIQDIALVAPLWEKLRDFQAERSTYFQKRFASMTFEKRIQPLLKKSESGGIKIDLVRDNEMGDMVGYCISSLADGKGEIDSIFIAAEYRGQKIGDRLMERALQWLDDNGIQEIGIGVVCGNDGVLPFYAKHGFRPRVFQLSRPI